VPTPLPDIDEVEHISENDEDLLQELREVLLKHGAEARFGLMLLHQHFPIADDEILVETVDAAGRTLTVRPQSAAAYRGIRSVETQWRLDVTGALQRCVQVCPGPNNEDHNGFPEHQNL
jgi:hypothetical protein